MGNYYYFQVNVGMVGSLSPEVQQKMKIMADFLKGRTNKNTNMNTQKNYLLLAEGSFR